MISVQDKLAQRINANMGKHNAAPAPNSHSGKEHVQLSVADIDTNPFQPRTVFPEEEIQSLAASIKENGLIQPITVRKAANGRYEIVHGERRWRAHKLLGLASIEAFIVHLDDQQMAVLALVENIQRADLADYDAGKAMVQITSAFATKSAMATALGISREDLYRYLSFGDLPPCATRRLDANPALFSKVTSYQIKNLIDSYGIRKVEPLLDKALANLEKGTLSHSRLAETVERELSAGTRKRTPAPTGLQRDGKKIGSYVKANGQMVIKLKQAALRPEQEEQLMTFLKSLEENA